MKNFSLRLCLVLIFSLALFIPQAQAKRRKVVIEDGKKVTFDYELTVDGKKVDSSEKSGPIEYTHGQKNIIPGLEKQMKGLKVGDKRSFFVNSNEAYGPANPQAFREIPKSELPQGLDPKLGQVLKVTDSTGRDFPAVVAEIKKDKIKLNFNHPLAGKDLNFQITIRDIK